MDDSNPPNESSHLNYQPHLHLRQKEKPMAIAEIETRPHNAAQERVMREVLGELDHQHAQGHTPETDLHNDPMHWHHLIEKHLRKGFDQPFPGSAPIANLEYRTQLVRVATLAVAAVLDYDRKVPDSNKDIQYGDEPLTPGHDIACNCHECGQTWEKANLGDSETGTAQ